MTRTPPFAEFSRDISYDPENGLLRWKRDVGARAKAGRIAGALDDKGYIALKYQGVTYRAHRIAWLLKTGDWPADGIDHANGVRSDNRWRNIRAATKAQNAQNLPPRNHNAAGFPGVTFHRGRYRATICLNYKCRHLGYFDSAQEAADAYRQAKSKLHTFCPEVRAA